MQEQDKIKELEMTILKLKARILDMQDATVSEREFHNNIFAKLAELLEIPSDRAGDVNSYFASIVELKTHASAIKQSEQAPAIPQNGFMSQV